MPNSIWDKPGALTSSEREELTRLRVQTVNRLRRLLSELLPGQAKRDITTGQAKAMLATIRPRDIAGKTRASDRGRGVGGAGRGRNLPQRCRRA